MSPIPRLKAYSGPALLSYGFRPFFLVGAIYAGLGVLIWLPLFFGDIMNSHRALAARLAHPRDAVRVSASGYHWLPVDRHSQLDRPAAASGRALGGPGRGMDRRPHRCLRLRGHRPARRRRHRRVVPCPDRRHSRPRGGCRAQLAKSPAGVHCPDLLRRQRHFPHRGSRDGTPRHSAARLGIAAAIALISLIGGRVIPSFTRNWLARENPGRLPVPFGRFDRVVLGVSSARLGVMDRQAGFSRARPR